MGIFDDQGYFGSADKRDPFAKAAGVRTVPKTAIAGSTPVPSYQRESSDGGPVPKVPSANVIQNRPGNPNGTRQGADDIPESTYRDGPPPPSLMETLLGHLQERFQRPDPSQFDTSAIDNALKGKIDLIEQLKAQTQGNFDKSDVNLQGMHDAFKHSIETDSANRFNQIADQQKQMLSQDTGHTVDALTNARTAAQNEREGMLQRLGIQAAGAAVDPSATAFNRGIAEAQSKGNTDQTLADNRRASDLALNNTMAQSVGMAGVQRRAALQTQLQSILGKADMGEMDAKSQAATAKSSLINDAQGIAYKSFNDQQDRYQKLFDTLLQDQTQNNRYNMQYGPDSPMRKAAAGGGGYAGIANDLANSGVDPNDAASGMDALNQILSAGDYMGNNQNANVDRTAVLAKLIADKTHNPGVAAQIAANYGKTSTLK